MATTLVKDNNEKVGSDYFESSKAVYGDGFGTKASDSCERYARESRS
jgi:hypothetical protein